MGESRYRRSRTLVRPLGRLPKEDPDQFKRKEDRLRDHFERFNRDVGELCQWLFGLRKQQASTDRPASFGPLGDFLLEPTLEGVEADERQRDRLRRIIFDDVLGVSPVQALADRPIPADLRHAMTDAAAMRLTPTAERLFDRLRTLERAHCQVLLKAVAEWIVARYRRGVENWIRQREEWEKEKAEWERKHPELALSKGWRNRCESRAYPGA